MKVMIIVKATKDSEAGVMPKASELTAMMKFNEELSNAGVLRELSGLKPSTAGARVVFDGDKRTVLDGPFAETKELIAGFWILEVKSLAEAVDWATRAPMGYSDGGYLEIRPFFEASDFTEATPETVARGATLQAKLKS